MQDETVPQPQKRLKKRSRQQRRRSRRRAGSYYLRIAATMAGGLCGAWMLFLFLSKVVHPYKLGYEVGREVTDMRGKVEAQEAANQTLRARIAYLRSDEGAEREARRAGYHRPGEVVYLLRSDEAAAADQKNAPVKND